MKCHKKLFKTILPDSTRLNLMKLKLMRLKDIMNSADLSSSESIVMLISSNLKKRRF